MSLFADGLLIVTCVTAAAYCFVLSRRLRKFADTENGVGRQIVQMNNALDEIRAALKDAQGGAKSASDALGREIVAARRLTMQLANANETTEQKLTDLQQSLRRATRVLEVPSQAAAPPGPGPAPALEPVTVEEVGSPEADHDPAAVALDDALRSATGEQKLGFLPEELDEADFDIAEVLETEIAADDAPGPAAGEAGNARARNEAGSTETSGDLPRNVLKVERMSL